MTQANGRRDGGPAGRSVVVFDLGGVLIDWNPRHLYRKLFAGDEAAMEHFLATICTQHWNERQDAGRSFAEAEAELIRVHPDKAELVRAWRRRFPEMIAGAIGGTVEIVERLHARGVPLYALSNWSRETFPSQRGRFAFFERFRGIVVSGEEGVIKPDRRIYEILFRRYALAPRDAVFVDDNPANARAADALGVHGIHFRSPGALADDLAALGLL